MPLVNVFFIVSNMSSILDLDTLTVSHHYGRVAYLNLGFIRYLITDYCAILRIVNPIPDGVFRQRGSILIPGFNLNRRSVNRKIPVKRIGHNPHFTIEKFATFRVIDNPEFCFTIRSA